MAVLNAHPLVPVLDWEILGVCYTVSLRFPTPCFRYIKHPIRLEQELFQGTYVSVCQDTTHQRLWHSGPPSVMCTGAVVALSHCTGKLPDAALKSAS